MFSRHHDAEEEVERVDVGHLKPRLYPRCIVSGRTCREVFQPHCSETAGKQKKTSAEVPNGVDSKRYEVFDRTLTTLVVTAGRFLRPRGIPAYVSIPRSPSW